MAKAPSLYGTLPEQLADPNSFASRLAEMLKVRAEHGIATGTLLDVPDVGHRSMLVMVNRLSIGAIQVTLLNFSGDEIAGPVISGELPIGGAVVDLQTGDEIATIDDLGTFYLTLQPYQALALMVRDPVAD
jgi:maltose alpha-D-glucosyltransferase/alpha-amylase